MILAFIFGLSCVVIIVKLYNKLTVGWCTSQVCLKRKTAIVTGANTGIGYETAIDFAKRGARVILACRNEERARAARDKIIKETHNTEVIYKIVDFARLKSVREFAMDVIKNETRLDILVNNAGIGNLKDRISEDGLLLLMQVNYFGPVLLTELLLDMLKNSNGRIVNVSSMIAKSAKILDVKMLNNYVGWRQYGVTKLCNILYTMQLADRLRGTLTTTYSLHPGVVSTDFFRVIPKFIRGTAQWMVGMIAKTAMDGAQTSIYCSVTDDIEKLSGEHFHDCHVVNRYKSVKDPLLPKIVWEETKKVLKLD